MPTKTTNVEFLFKIDPKKRIEQFHRYQDNFSMRKGRLVIM